MGVPVTESAARMASASLRGSPLPLKWRYLTAGDSFRRWLCRAVTSIPLATSCTITGETSFSRRTRSPIIMALFPVPLKPIQEVSASPGSTATSPTVTFRSERGNVTFNISSCTAPFRPRVVSTPCQSRCSARTNDEKHINRIVTRTIPFMALLPKPDVDAGDGCPANERGNGRPVCEYGGAHVVQCWNPYAHVDDVRRGYEHDCVRA